MPTERSTRGRRAQREASESDATESETTNETTTTTTASETTNGTATTTTTTETNNSTATESTHKDKEDQTTTNMEIENRKQAPVQRPASIRSNRRSTKLNHAVALARAKEELAKKQVELAAAHIAALEAEAEAEDEVSEDDDITLLQETEIRVGTWITETQSQHPRNTSEDQHDQKKSNMKTPTDAAQTHPKPPAVKEKAKNEDDIQRNNSIYPKNEQNHAASQQQQINLTELASAIAIAARSGSHQHHYDLPHFYGAYQEWLSFKTTYDESSISLTETEKISRLRRCLKGRAKEAVDNLLIYGTKSEDIMKTLESRFGRPDVIALAELERLRALPRLTDTPKDVCIFASRVSNIVATLRTLNRVHYLYSPEASKAIMDKLTTTLKYRWFDYAAIENHEEPELLKLMKFLDREAQRCGPYAQPETNPGFTEHTIKRTQKTFTMNDSNDNRKCPVCSTEAHRVEQCKEFNKADVEKRWDIAKQRRLCFSCLRYRTRLHRCRPTVCEENGCRLKHHRLLHFVKQIEPSEETEQKEVVTSTWAKTRRAYLKIVPVRASGPAGAVDTYALIDDGSTVSFIDADIQKQTGARGPSDPLNIEAFANTEITAAQSRRVTLTLHGTSRKHKFSANTIENMKLSTQTISEEDLRDCTHLEDIGEYLKYQQAKPQILIGQDNIELLLACEVRKGQQHQPVASLTTLGWVLHGANTRVLGRRQQVHYVNHIVTSEENMDEQLRKHFALENIGIEPKRPRNNPEQRALDKLNESVTQTENGQYQAPLLWKHEKIEMPNNYENTLRRLELLEKKLDRKPQMKTEYEAQMQALIDNGYAEPAPMKNSENRTWYLPHFYVLNPSKPGKLRIVHDAAAKTKGVSLNDHLLTGPDLLQSLPGVLMRFREHPIAVCADIKAMFMQVKIKPEDRDALRYLWRGGKRNNSPQEYRMTSLIFGATCSPSIAIYVKDTNAAKYEKTHPEAVSAIVKNHYVDDYLHSYKSVEEAIATAKQIQTIHREAHYELRQWASNSTEVIAALEPGTTQKEIIELNKEVKIERVLGLIWKSTTDELTFDLNLLKLPPNALENNEPTKREILKILMSIFDPLGLASPVTVNAKRILQEVWRRGTGWDEKLHKDLIKQWKTWIQHMNKLRNIAIPRCYPGYSQAQQLELHVFVDASETAYAAALYWRTTSPNGEIHVTLITAKAKVAPLKVTSIPRLELQAAVMGSRLATSVLEEHEKTVPKTFWTDSKTALTWIKTGSRSYRPYVAHRIAAIEENSTVSEWRWVPTKLNVADDATRDVPHEFNNEHRWFRGPEFLHQDPKTWPIEQPSRIENTGEEKVHFLSKTASVGLRETAPDYNRFSKWERLLRSTARVLQFIDLCKRKTEKTNYSHNKRINEKLPIKKTYIKPTNNENTEKKYLTIEAKHLTAAETLLVRISQRESFNEEIRKLEYSKALPTDSKLRALSVELVNGVITLRTRIDAADGITEQQRRPPVLDGNNYVAKLFIDYVHRKLHHLGVEAVVNECRQRYYILRMRPIARATVRGCRACRIKRAAPPTPPTGDHPRSRLAHHQRPFTYTGVDYFGPLTVTVGRTTQKRYVALFTCLTTRAVHLEIAGSLNTESAVMALRRMIARRGCPSEIWSDNGTNLHGAAKELRTTIDRAVEDEASTHTIAWRFIPPAAPFMGGAWERLVRSVKTALSTVLKERCPTEEVLSTLLAEVEFTVNSRPLTHVSVDPEDPESITPNHFLLNGPARSPSIGTFTDSDLIGRTHWRASQRLADQFWARWVIEYLPTLQDRREPYGRGPTLKTGNVVLVVDNTLPRNMWPMGIVTATYPGNDGIVRAADVTTKGGTLRRPTKKLVIIPTEGAVPD